MRARDNPFATSRLERVLRFDPELIGTDWQRIETRWELLGHRACVVGRHGSGKTSFLDAFATRIEKRMPVVRLFFNDSHRRLDADDRARLADLRGVCLVVDGDAHLPLRERIELSRRSREASGFLSARHRPGRLPVLLRVKSDPELASALLERAWPDAVAALGPELNERWKHHRGNLRSLWLDCYDLWNKNFS